MDNQTTIYGALVIAVLVVTVLAFIVVIQARRIHDLTNPKIGFLGKPLAVIAVTVLALGTYGTYYYSQNIEPEVTEVSADSQVTLTINYEVFNASTNEYIFQVVPTVDSVEWGGSDDLQFDIYWTFSNGDTKTQIEFDITRTSPGGVTFILAEGVNTIEAAMFVGDKRISSEVTVEI